MGCCVRTILQLCGCHGTQNHSSPPCTSSSSPTVSSPSHTLPLPVPSPLRGAFLLQLLCDYSERLGAMLDGRHVELTTRQLSGGARVRHVFQELLGRSLRELQPVRGISDEEICTVIKNGAGVTGEGQGGVGGKGEAGGGRVRENGLLRGLHRLFVCFWVTDGVVGMVEWVGPACDGERQGREEVL